VAGSTSIVELDLASLDHVAGCARRLLDGTTISPP
jgi:hypothetical protein